MENKFWCNTITKIVEQKLCRFDFIEAFKLITSLGRFVQNQNLNVPFKKSLTKPVITGLKKFRKDICLMLEGDDFKSPVDSIFEEVRHHKS